MLKDKVAVVTGGGRGIGRAITLAYAREGADLVLAARSIEALTETKAAVESLGRKALVVPTDVRHEESVQPGGAGAKSLRSSRRTCEQQRHRWSHCPSVGNHACRLAGDLRRQRDWRIPVLPSLPSYDD